MTNFALIIFKIVVIQWMLLTWMDKKMDKPVGTALDIVILIWQDKGSGWVVWRLCFEKWKRWELDHVAGGCIFSVRQEYFFTKKISLFNLHQCCDFGYYKRHRMLLFFFRKRLILVIKRARLNSRYLPTSCVVFINFCPEGHFGSIEAILLAPPSRLQWVTSESWVI